MNRPAKMPRAMASIWFMLATITMVAAPAIAQEHPGGHQHTFALPESFGGLDVRQELSGITANHLVTAVFVDEGALVFEQSWYLVTNQPYLFLSHPSIAPGLEIHVPDGATNVRVVNLAEGLNVSTEPTGVVHYGPIGPPGTLPDEQTRLVIQFVIESADSEYRFEQVMPTHVDDVTIVVPQTTMFHSDIELDVQLSVPPCETGSDDLRVVCFPDPSTPGMAQVNPYPNIYNRIAGSGVGNAGSNLVFVTEGWPTPPTYSKTTATMFGAIVVVVSLLGLPLVKTRRKAAAAEQPNRKQLNVEQRLLLRQLAVLKEAYEQGSLPLSEYSMNDLLLRYRLDEVYAELGLEPEEP